MTVSAQLDVTLALTNTATAVLGKSAAWRGEIASSVALGDGTGASEFDLLYAAERTVASASNDDIDLSGVLTDALGATITAAEIVGIVIVNKRANGTANTTSLTVGGGSNPFTGFLGGTTPTITKIGPGGMFVLISPDATGLGTVAAGTGDILRVANSSGASATYQIAILGRSA